MGTRDLTIQDDSRLTYAFFKTKMPSKVAKPKISKKAGSNAGSPSTSPKAVKPALTAHVESPGGDAATSVVAKKGRGRPAGAAGGAGRKKKKKDHKYRTHMGIVLRQVHPDIRISSQAVATMNSFLDDILERIVDWLTIRNEKQNDRGLPYEKFRRPVASSFLVSWPNTLFPKEPRPSPNTSLNPNK